MTAGQKRKFLDAVDGIEQGASTRLSPREVCDVFVSRFPDLWAELMEPLAIAHALQLISARRGSPARSHRPAAAQLTLALPGLGEVTVPAAIQIPAVRRRGRPHGHGRWGKTLEVSVREFGMYLHREEQRLKDVSQKRRERLKPQREMYRMALAGAKGNMGLTMQDALRVRMSKRKAGLLEFDFGE